MGLLAFVVIGALIGIVIGYRLPVAPGGGPLASVIGLTGGLVGGIAAAVLIGMNPLTQFWSLIAWLAAAAGAVVIMSLFALIAAPGPDPAEPTGSGDRTTSGAGP